MKKLFCLLFIVFGLSFILLSHDTFALEQSYTWDFNTHPELYVCGGDTGINCSDYSYVKFHPTSSCTGNGASFYVFGLGSFQGNSLISACSDIIAPVNTTLVRLTGGVNVASNYSGSIVVTLTDELASCNCPEPEPPEPCEDPEENSQFIKVVLDAFWKYHTVFASCVAALIAIFVVYRIIKGMLR